MAERRTLIWSEIKLVDGYTLGPKGLEVTGKPSFRGAGAAGLLLSGLERLSQKALVEWYLDIKQRFPEKYSQLLDPDHFNEDTLRTYVSVVRAIPKENWKLDEGVSWGKHQAVSGLDVINQRKILEKAAAQKLTLAEVRQAVRQVRRRTVASGAAELEGQYRVIYCWPDYEAVSLADLEKMPIAAHAQANAALFLGCPEALRFEIAAVLEAWGFVHKRAFIWDRQLHGGADAYLSIQHEHLLWCVRGKLPPDRLTPMQDSVLSVKPPSDGGKPERFRTVIEQLYDGPYLELFASREHPGWTTWGKTVGAAVA